METERHDDPTESKMCEEEEEKALLKQVETKIQKSQTSTAKVIAKQPSAEHQAMKLTGASATSYSKLYQILQEASR